MRKGHAIRIAAALALLCQQGAALAQLSDAVSANQMMQGCRDLINASERNDVGQAECTGIIGKIFFVLEPHSGTCIPGKATIGQAVRVIVRYIDQRPARMHERFEDLALEALQQAWPCRR